MGLFSKPEIATPPHLKLKESLDSLRADIAQSQSFRKKVNGWSSNFLGAGIGLAVIAFLIPIELPLIGAISVFSFIGYAATRVIKASVDEGIEDKQKKIEELLTTHPVPLAPVAPVNQNGAKVTNAYNSEAARIAALEKRVQQLKDELEQKPVILDKPKSIKSKTGFGG